MTRKANSKPKQQLQRQTNRTNNNERRENQIGKQSNLNRIGALWLGETRNGKRMMSGRIELTENQEIRVLVFKNDYKETESQPDYVIYEPENREDNSNRDRAAKEWKKDDDIPF